MSRKITNTATDSLAADLHRAVGHGVPPAAIMPSGAIEAQEAAGQRELLMSDRLPLATGGDEPFIALGFAFGPYDDGDIFRPARLPEGWEREGSDHAMWSYIVDADGYRRVAIFYKAAYYDRSAHMHLERVPRTTAQADAWEAIGPGHSAPWCGGKDRREGANYIYVWNGRYGDNAAPEGKHAYSDDGRRLEVEVAPDGSIVDRREFTAAPEDES